MGCCLGTIVALLAPRVAMLAVYVLTNWFDRAYETWYVPLLGFFLMPYTTLAYLAGMVHSQSISGGWLVLVVLAVLVDLGAWGGGHRSSGVLRVRWGGGGRRRA